MLEIIIKMSYPFNSFLRRATGLIFFFFLSVCVGVSIAQMPPNFDEWVEAGMEEWGIPGMAVTVVKGGEVIHLKGYGIKGLGEEAAVDEHTLFGIASLSKNMTAAALALLIDEGKLEWDDRVIDHIPWFELSDPWITSEVTVRDLLTHRVGLGRMLGNRLQFMTNSDRDEVLYRMRYMDFEAPFRSRYVYSNVMYSAAGQLIEYIEGISWDEFMVSRLFQPLGMERTNTSITQLEGMENVAWPHQEIYGKVQLIQRRNWDNAGPAGGVNSSAYDLAKWLMLQLEQPGKYNDTILISRRQMEEIHRPQVVLPISDPYGSQAAYGLGWRITDYLGHRILTHGGATDGFNTSAYLLPEHDLGIVVVTNNFNLFREAVCFTIIDQILAIDGSDWHEHYLDRYNRTYDRAMNLRQEIHDNRDQNLQPTFDSKAHLGAYYHPAYGKVEVFSMDSALMLKFWEDDDLTARLEHWQGNTYRAIWSNPAQREEFCWFTGGKNSEVEKLHFEFCLRPILLQVGAYPSNYTRVVEFKKVDEIND